MEPIFIRNADMPEEDTAPITVYEALSNSFGATNIEGIQRIAGLWRIYMKNKAKRLDIITKQTVVINEKHVRLYDENPFNNNNQKNEKRDKLTVRGLPLSVNNDEIKQILEEQQVKICSPIKFTFLRKEDGTLTSCKTGDRFMFIEKADETVKRNHTIGGYQCTIVHHGRNNFLCKSCNKIGHKIGDETCQAKAKEDKTLAFSGYQHPLSNEYPTPIQAFKQHKPFSSITQAYLWKMANDLDQTELAEEICAAKHAGMVKRMSKRIPDEVKRSWEEKEENLDTMKKLLDIKARTCCEFRQLLIDNQEKILAEATSDLRWGTGQSKYVTERTDPEFWPGNNYLGMMLMDIQIADLMQYEAKAQTNEIGSKQEKAKEEEEEEEEDEQQQRQQQQQQLQETEKNEDEEDMKENNQDKEASKQSPKIKAKMNNNNQKQKVKDSGKSKDKTTPSIPSTSKKQHQARSTERQGARHRTPTKDIRKYLDLTTRKRKQQETTPEKNEKPSKQTYTR